MLSHMKREGMRPICVTSLPWLVICFLCSLCIAQDPVASPVQRESSQTRVDEIGRILQVEVGGSGRFLILRLENRLAIFDILPGKIVSHVPLSSGKTVIAAGKSILVVIDPATKQIQRWSLPEARKLSETTLNVEMQVGQAAIGAASDGPLLLVPEPCQWPLEEIRLLNLQTLIPMDEEIELLGRVFHAPDEGRPGFVTASDDGTTYYVGPTGFLLRVEPNRVVGRFCTEIDWTNPMQPGRLGRTLFGWGVPLNQSDTKTLPEVIDQARTRGIENQITIHDHDGPFYLSLRPVEDGSDLEMLYFATGELEPLGKVPGVALETGEGHLPVTQRVHLLSQTGVIVTVNDRVGRIVVHRMSPDDVLPSNDPRRLALRPPSSLIANAEQAFAHQLQLVGQNSETKFEILGGPDGLTVDQNGVLRWLPPELGKDMAIDVNLRASQGKNQMVHPLVITVRSLRGRSGDVQDGARYDRRGTGAKWLVDSPSKDWLTETGNGEPMEEPIKLRVGTKPSLIRPAAEGRALLFRQPGKISILCTRTGELMAQLPAPHTGTHFAAGLDCVVVHDPIEQSLTRWRLSDLTISHQVKVPFAGEARLMLLGASSDGPLLVEARGAHAIHRFDSQTLESLAMLPIRYLNQRPHFRPPPDTVRAISENGSTLLAARFNECVSVVPSDAQYSAYIHRQSGSQFARVSADGQQIYSDVDAFDRYWRPQPFKASSGVLFPTVSGPFFCRFRAEQYQVGSSFRPKHGYRLHAEFFHRHFSEPLATLNNLPLVEPQKHLQHVNLRDEQLWIVPSVNRLVRFDSQTIEFVLHHWDVQAALKRLPTMQPIVVSSPSVWIRRGSSWSYQLESLTKGKISYRIPVKPDGMELHEDGKLTWNVPTDLTEHNHRVVIVATNEYGKEENHAFNLFVLR